MVHGYLQSSMKQNWMCTQNYNQGRQWGFWDFAQFIVIGLAKFKSHSWLLLCVLLQLCDFDSCIWVIKWNNIVYKVAQGS